MGERPRLTRDVLASERQRLEASASLPERAVQFGTGAFLRGFIDDFLHRANERGFWRGRIVAIGSTGSNRDQALRDQDGLYTLIVRGIAADQVVDERRVIASVSRALSAVDDWSAVLELARSPELEFICSNTTEVGIVLSETDRFDDMPPGSFPGKLTRFLFERAQAFDFAGHGLVVLPCELIENNGAKLCEIVLALATRWNVDARFVEWLRSDVTFCNTLVDRIVPGAPKGKDAEQLAQELGYEDALLTCCEPYYLFAIEGPESIRAALPWASGDVGIIIAPDIAPYRARKLYILNGAHTAFVPTAILLGCETVAEAMARPDIAGFVRQAVFDEIVPTLPVERAEEFAEAVIDRFRNPFIRHALVDITLQATMKMRHRIVPSIRRYVEQRGEVPQALTFGLAAFLLLKREPAQRPDDQGAPIAIAWARHGEDYPSFVEEVLGNVSLWGLDLNVMPGVADAVTAHLEAIRSHGIGGVIPSEQSFARTDPLQSNHAH